MNVDDDIFDAIKNMYQELKEMEGNGDLSELDIIYIPDEMKKSLAEYYGDKNEY